MAVLNKNMAILLNLPKFKKNTRFLFTFKIGIKEI